MCVALLATVSPVHAQRRGRGRSSRQGNGAQQQQQQQGAGDEQQQPAGDEEQTAPDDQQQPPEGGEEQQQPALPEPDPNAPEPPPAPWHWHQLLATPRIGGRLTAIAVDPRNTQHVIVGTEEGTILRSYDGGQTFDEREVTPQVVQARSLGVRSIGAPAGVRSGRRTFSTVDLAPDIDLFDDSTTALQGQGSASLRSAEVDRSVQVSLNPNRRPPGLLYEVLGGRANRTTPITRVALCPGARYPLLVTTPRELLGSPDDGVTFIPLFTRAEALLTNANEFPIQSLACSPARPNEIVMGTNAGPMRSIDGGLTFTESMRGAPTGGVTAVAYDVPAAAEGATPALLLGADEALFAGDPDSEDGLQFVYPDFSNPSGAPYLSIRWIETTPSAQIWLATDDGVRVSRDGGEHWAITGVAFFDRRPMMAVMSGVNEQGGQRVAVLTDDWAYSTDDDGRTWQPFFWGITRRHLTGMAVSPGGEGQPSVWWIIAGGELWSTRDLTAGGLDHTNALWARSRLRHTPPLGTVQELAFEHLHLSSSTIDGLSARARAASFMPRLDVSLSLTDQRYMLTSVYSLTDVATVTTQRDSVPIGVFASASWSLPDMVYRSLNDERAALYQLRQQVGFVIEDAWHERWILLERLANGRGGSPAQQAVHRARIESLEVVLENWLGRPLAAFAVSGQGRTDGG